MIQRTYPIFFDHAEIKKQREKKSRGPPDTKEIVVHAVQPGMFIGLVGLVSSESGLESGKVTGVSYSPAHMATGLQAFILVWSSSSDYSNPSFYGSGQNLKMLPSRLLGCPCSMGSALSTAWNLIWCNARINFTINLYTVSTGIYSLDEHCKPSCTV